MTTVAEEVLRDMMAAADPEIDLLLSNEPCSDIGNAQRLIKRFGDDLKHVQDLGWLVWTGTHFKSEHGDREAQKRAHEVARLIMREAASLESVGPRVDPHSGRAIETRDEFEKRVERRRKWSTTSGNMPRVRGMMDAAAVDLARGRAELDANPFAFNVLNGTIDLLPDGSAVLRPHDRADLITRVAPVVYDPKAECPRFLEWLRFIQPDAADKNADGDHYPVGEIRTLLQTFFGYCLTGSTALQVALMFCGPGANGKSTLVNVMRGIFGPYAQTMPVETLLENDRRSGGDATPETARLPGVRLALASEPEKKSRLSTAKLKQFTGGEPISARPLYGEFFELNPTFKMILSFNDRPSVPAQDDGTWRRLLLVGFDQKIPREQRKEQYESELLKEAPGILNWFIAGYKVWRTEGLSIPEAVQTATEEYRNDNDPVGQFLVDCCEPPAEILPDVGGVFPFERAVSLYSAYEVWCDGVAADPISKRGFGLQLRNKGYHGRNSNGTVYDKIRLKQEWFTKANDLISRRA